MVEQAHLAPFLYHVQVDVDPIKGKAYIEWLGNKHIKDVLEHPGFLWARRTPLDVPAEDGWKRFMVTYAIRSREDFLAYRESDFFKTLAKELEQFEGVFRVQRFYGQVDLAFD